jgi:hypothetical protein
MIEKGLRNDDARIATPSPTMTPRSGAAAATDFPAGEAADDVDQCRAPAILASWRGEAPVRESISSFPQLVEFQGRGWLA